MRRIVSPPAAGTALETLRGWPRRRSGLSLDGDDHVVALSSRQRGPVTKTPKPDQLEALCPTTDWSDVVDRLDLLISAVERVADASESMKADLRDIEDNMSSLRFDVASIEADVTLIQLAMP